MKCRLTNLRHCILPVVDLQALISKCGRWFISVNSRLSVSDGWRSRRFAQLLSASTDGNIFDFRNIAFPGTMSARWSLKCIPRRRDFANHITPWGVDIGRRRPERNKWPSLHQV